MLYVEASAIQAIQAKVQRKFVLMNKWRIIWAFASLSPPSIFYLRSRVCYSMLSINSIGTEIRMQSSCRESMRLEWDSIQFDLLEEKERFYVRMCVLSGLNVLEWKCWA